MSGGGSSGTVVTSWGGGGGGGGQGSITSVAGLGRTVNGGNYNYPSSPGATGNISAAGAGGTNLSVSQTVSKGGNGGAFGTAGGAGYTYGVPQPGGAGGAAGAAIVGSANVTRTGSGAYYGALN